MLGFGAPVLALALLPDGRPLSRRWARAIWIGLAERDALRTGEMLVQLQGEATDALEDLRDLARGIYPPLLADKGLIAALEAQARKVPIPTTVQGYGIDRYDQDLEAAVYFSCLEAIQNVTKYAEATPAVFRLVQTNGDLRFDVTDDGHCFDAARSSFGTGLQRIADRLAALGGTVEVRSTAGVGTTVAGSLPIGADR